MASISISGWGVGRYYTLTVTEQSYDAVANTSVVRWTLSASGDGGTWYDYYLYASVNGTAVYNKSGSWSDGAFPAAAGSTSGTMTISHNADGTKSIGFYIEGYAYQYSTKNASGTLALTNIDRTAPTITASSPSSITINSMSVTATSNVQCDQFAVRYGVSGGNYGAWTYWTGDATSHAFSLTGLSNNTTYSIEVAGKKKSNGVWGYSSAVTGKTLGASTITSAGDVTLGNACNVKWTPLNNTFKFTLKFSLGSWSHTTGYISPASTSAYTYTSYTIPLTVANQLPNATTGTMTVVLTTYTSSNDQVGLASSETFTVTVPSSIVPTISSVTLQEGTSSGYGVYVKTLSTVKATVTASGAYSSTIASRVVKFDTVSVTANSSGVATSPVLSTYGTLTILTTVTDSRGRTATNSKNITVYDYWQPTANIEISISGTTVTTTVTGSIAPVNNLNAKSLLITRKRMSDSSTTTYPVNPLSAYNYSVTWTQTISDIGTESYEYTAAVTDTKQTVTVKRQTAVICVSRHAGGRGVTLFGEAKRDGLWVVEDNIYKNIGYGHIEYIKGTQTASTNAWTGVTKDEVLYDGKMIMYVLPYAGTSTGATLNLTLAGGGTTGAKAIYRYGGTTAITTHYAALSRILLIYDSANNRWNSSAWYDTTYSSQAAASGGTAVSLVTTGEKYTWNNKQNAGLGTPTATDFNNITTSGIYWINPSTTTGNNPKAGEYGYLEVLATTGLNSGAIVQKFSVWNSSIKYERLYANDAWNPWHLISGQEVYSASGYIVSGNNGLAGYGIAEVCLMSDKVRVDFAFNVTQGGSGGFAWGINSIRLNMINPNIPSTITPLGSPCGTCTYYYGGSIYGNLTGFGGTVNVVSSYPQLWGFGRIYDSSGANGMWAENSVPSNTYITGTAYGKISS